MKVIVDSDLSFLGKPETNHIIRATYLKRGQAKTIAFGHCGILYRIRVSCSYTDVITIEPNRKNNQ